MAYRDDVLALGPVHYWELQANANDSAGALNGTNSGVAFTGGAIQPDATTSALWERASDTISIASDASINAQTITQQTWSTVFQPNLDTLPFTMIKVGSNTSGIHMFLAGGMVPAMTVVSGGSEVTIFSERALSIGVPASVVFRYDAGEAAILIDGRVVAFDDTAPASIASSTATTYIGGQGATSGTVAIPGGTFTLYTISGQFSDVAMWNSALTDAQIFDTLFSLSALPVTATAAFTDVPDKTEVRLFELTALGGDFVSEFGSGEEYVNFGPVDIDVDYAVTTTVPARLLLINVEDRFETVSQDVLLTREGAVFPVDLLLVDDRVYDNDFLQEFPPINVTAPVASGVGEVGQILSVTDGTWTGTPPITYSYQWRRDTVDIPGATSSTYTLVGADDGTLVDCEVTATNVVSSASSISNAISLLPSGQIAQFRHTGAYTVTTTSTIVDFDTQLRNDMSVSNSSGTYTLPSGRYLVNAQGAWIGSGSNGRGNFVIEIRKNGTVVTGAKGSGYQRDTANDAAWANATTVVQSNGTDSITVQFYRDTDGNVGALNSARTVLSIVSLADSTAFSEYQPTTTPTLGATTYANVPLSSTITETDAGVISRSGDTVTLAANRKFLVCGGAFFNSTTARTARFTRLTLDGSHVSGSMGYAYMRQSSDEFGAPNSFALIETGGSAQTLNLQARRPLQLNGATSVDGGGALVAAESGLIVAELLSSADWFHGEDSAGGQALNTASATILVNNTTVRTDTGIFSSRTATNLTLSVDKDLFLAAGVMALRSSASGTRHTREASFQLDGTSDLNTAQGEYNRGDQGSQDVFDSTYNPRGVVSATASQVLTLVVDEAADTGWNDGGGGPNTYGAEPLGLFALDLSTV